jgi:hypothetical protein
MKTTARIFALLVVLSITAAAQDTPYQSAMKKEIAKLITADSLSHLQQSANAFARIAGLNPNEWQPVYYQALAYTYQGFNRTFTADRRDEVLSQAEELVKKADAISANNPEIVTLQGFVIMAKLNVDPASRGQSLSGAAMNTFGKSLALDNKNPRTLVLMAQMEYGMAQFFGSSTEKACGLAKQSLAIFNGQNEEALKTAIVPTWGKDQAEGLVSKCR